MVPFHEEINRNCGLITLKKKSVLFLDYNELYKIYTNLINWMCATFDGPRAAVETGSVNRGLRKQGCEQMAK